MKRSPMTAALLALALAGCGGDGDAPKMEVRVYAVPTEQTDALRQALANVLSAAADKTPTGHVSSPAPGQLIVLAPKNLQGSIEASLRALTKDAPPPAAAATATGPLRLSFWSVDAVPEAGPDDAALTQLVPALEEVRKQFGAVHFELRDHVSAVSDPNQTVQRSWLGVAGAGASPPLKQLQYSFKKEADGLALTIQFGDQLPIGHGGTGYVNAGSQTTTTVRPGQTLILTQSPIPDPDAASSTLTRLYLVRVDDVPTK
ncbi:MAG TPA: hypothetical protein VGC30_01660 [Dokdonella sp.]